MHRVLAQLYELAEQNSPLARITFGDARFEPGSRNTVPEQVVVTLDMRHPDDDILNQMERSLKAIVAAESETANVAGAVRDEWKSPAIRFDEACVEAVAESASAFGYRAMRLASGAGHDSVYVSKVAPTAMIFVPCEQGISHNEAESANKDDLAAGCDVLLNAVVSLAQT